MPGVDNGPIVDTNCFSIKQNDTAETLHYKNTLAMVNLVTKNIKEIMGGGIKFRAQMEKTPTFYPKRNKQDGLIDWDDDINNIDRPRRAVSKPFGGAFSYVDGEEIIFERVNIFYSDLEEHAFKEERTVRYAMYFKVEVPCEMHRGRVNSAYYSTTKKLSPGMRRCQTMGVSAILREQIWFLI